MNQCNIVQLLKESVHRPSGELQISHNGVTWNIGLSGAQLHYAFHSLQTLDNLEQFMQVLGFEFALPNYRTLVKANKEWQITDAVEHLFTQQLLNQAQIQRLLQSVATAALESLCWTNQVEAHWQEKAIVQPGLQSVQIELNGLIHDLEQRTNTWKSLPPIITSPDQCPRCDDINRLQQPIPQGVLPPQTLVMIGRLMQGISIRQLAFLLKQDVLKLCQVLHPYISAGSLRLEPPQPPRNRLPTIPTATAPVAIEHPPTPNASPSGGTAQKQYKVVCIDDSPTVLDTIQRYLGTEQFSVATVEDPMASLSALFDMKPDLILMDVSMPGIDGNRLCQILKRSSVFTHVPIIMVSGNTGILDKEKAKAAGATDYLTKPFSKAELLAIVNQYLVQEATYAT